MANAPKNPHAAMLSFTFHLLRYITLDPLQVERRTLTISAASFPAAYRSTLRRIRRWAGEWSISTVS